MQTTTTAPATSQPLVFARHLIGMGIVALANPLIYYSDNPTRAWLETWLHPIAFALIAFGLYTLFLTKRAKQAWPKSFFILAWVLLALLVAGPWINHSRTSAPPAESQVRTPAPVTAPTATPATVDDDKEWWKKGSTQIN